MLQIEANFSEFIKGLEAQGKAVGFAQVVALTRTAKATVEEFLPAEAARVFDRPTRWTLGGFYWRPATADNKVLEIGIKEFGGKGTPASKFLLAQVMGGARKQKRSERALGFKGLLGNKGYWVPGAGIKLDAYGNVPGSTMVRILSDLQAFSEVGYVANRTAKSAKRKRTNRTVRYFVPDARSKLHPGVWMRRANGSIAPALLFVSTVSYSPRFDFFGKGKAFAEQRFPVELDRAIAEGYSKPKP